MCKGGGINIFKIIPLSIETPFTVGNVNAYVVIGESVTLIDTGLPGKKSLEKLRYLLKQEGLTFKELDEIVVTHLHTDHAGGVKDIQEEIDIPTFVHEGAKHILYGGIDEFNRTRNFLNYFVKECGADPESHQSKHRYHNMNWQHVKYVSNEDHVFVGGRRFSVLFVPGHSQTDMILWDPETGLTFAGDHLLKDISVNAFIEPPIPFEQERPKPLIQYRESLMKTRALPLTTIYPGHGRPFSDHVSIIDRRLNEHNYRCDQIRKVLRTSDKTVYQICIEVFPRLKGKLVFLGLSQVQGHLDLMESRNEVFVDKSSEGINVYRLYE
ncbi:MBL fold metallo-hydrolase [Cytobacillus sp. Hm23]